MTPLEQSEITVEKLMKELALYKEGYELRKASQTCQMPVSDWKRLIEIEEELGI